MKRNKKQNVLTLNARTFYAKLKKQIYFFFTRKAPPIKARTNNTRKTKNKIFAILAAPAAIPVNPNSAAIKAITKNITDQRNIIYFFNC